MKTALRWISRLIFLIVIAWAAGVVMYAPLSPAAYRSYILAGLLATYVFSLLPRRARGWIFLGLTIELAAIVFFWASLKPRSDRAWAPEYARMPLFEINGDEVTIRNVRNFQYKSAADFVPEYYDKSVKLSELSSFDIFASYWAGKSIAHIIISFGFAEKEYVAVSIETRREQAEGYSTVDGFFRNYELIYVVADERDLIRLRTTVREPAETVYLLRTNMALGTARRFFLDYAKTINDLAIRPKFYNTLLTNCTSQVYFHTRVNEDALPYNWKLFLSGYVPEYLFDIKALAPGLTMDEILARGKVNARAISAGDSEDFSIKIRDGVPKPAPVPD